MKFGNIFVGKRLFVGYGLPEALGKGEEEIRGSAYIEGPLQVGADAQYESVEATVMIGEEYNPDTQEPPDLALKVKGNVHIEGTWYVVNPEDVETVIEEHVIGGNKVDSLINEGMKIELES